MQRVGVADFGLGLVVVAGFGFGLNPLFARLAYDAGLSPEAALLYRFAGLLLVTLPLAGKVLQRPRLLLRGLALGAVMALGTLSYFRALAVLPVATAVMVYYTYPVFTILFGWLASGRPPDRGAVVAVIMVLMAVVLVARPEALSPGQLDALLLCFLAPIGFALLIHGFVAWLAELPTLARSAATTWGHLLVLVPAALWGGAGSAVPASAEGWTAALGLATVASLLPQVCFIYGAPRAGSARTAVGGSTELVTSVLVGWLVFAEPAGPQTVAGAVLMLAALFVVRGRAA